MAAYGVLDDVKNLTTTVGDKVDSKLKSSLTDTDTSTTTATASKSDGQIVSDVKDIVLPTTSEILWGIVDGSIGSILWQSLTSSTGSLASYLLNLAADNTSGAVSSVLSWVAKGAAYSWLCRWQGRQLPDLGEVPGPGRRHRCQHQPLRHREVDGAAGPHQHRQAGRGLSRERLQAL